MTNVSTSPRERASTAKSGGSSSGLSKVGSGRRSSPGEATTSESSPSDAPATTSAISIAAEEFDAAFDRGESVVPYLNMSTLRRPGLEPKRVNVDFPLWMVDQLDAEARRVGVTRQSLIKLWLAERLESAGKVSPTAP